MSDLDDSDSAACDDYDWIADENLVSLTPVDLMRPTMSLLSTRDSVTVTMIAGDVTMTVLLAIMMVSDPSYFVGSWLYLSNNLAYPTVIPFIFSLCLQFVVQFYVADDAISLRNELLLNDPGKS